MLLNSIEKPRGCLVYVFKQSFLVFKQHFTHFYALFYPRVFPQKFSNNNFQFLNTCTKRAPNYQHLQNYNKVLGLIKYNHGGNKLPLG